MKLDRDRLIQAMMVSAVTVGTATLGYRVFKQIKRVLEDVEEERELVKEVEETPIRETSGYAERWDVDPLPERLYYEVTEATELRHDPNSKAAMKQYRDMLMSDISKKDKVTYQVINSLWEFEYVPVTKADHKLAHTIISDRQNFFGENSKWVTEGEATFAEVFLYFAELAKFDVDYDFTETLGFMLQNANIYMDNISFTHLREQLYSIETHQIRTGPDSFGVFALDSDAYLMMLEQINEADGEGLMSHYEAWIFDEVNKEW